MSNRHPANLPVDIAVSVRFLTTFFECFEDNIQSPLATEHERKTLWNLSISYSNVMYNDGVDAQLIPFAQHNFRDHVPCIRQWLLRSFYGK